MKRSAQVVLGAAAIAVVAASPAVAQDSNAGPYAAIGGAWVMPKDSEIDGPNGGDVEVEWDDGWAAMGALGYAYGNGLRTELEVTWRANGADSIDGAAAGGDVNSFSGMLNVLYDVDFGLPLKPYIGAGIGAARVEMEDVALAAGGPALDDGGMSWAYQGIAGAAYGLTDNLDLTLDYRYFSAPDVNLDNDIDAEYSAHNVMLGVRYTFGAPPAPPPEPAPEPQPEPVATPAQPRDYLVFFEFDQSNLTPEAQQVLDQAAAAAQNMQPTVINVTGHADRSGPADYNERLSMRRADSVANYLAAQGVPMQEMAIEAEGETQPLVPTADGVREPQNRRVMINIQP